MILENDWLFRGEQYSCDLRAAGVLVRDGKLLVQRDQGGSEYALPGGHVRIGETTADALVREYREETGADVRVERLLWTEECFWTWKGILVHNISFYYLIGLENETDIPDTGEFVPHRDNERVEIGWMPLTVLSGVTILRRGFLLHGTRVCVCRGRCGMRIPGTWRTGFLA